MNKILQNFYTNAYICNIQLGLPAFLTGEYIIFQAEKSLSQRVMLFQFSISLVWAASTGLPSLGQL
ncbi:hypothetical protein CMK12_07245 [Candidatus Poribacteria bacterium]|nr:hypothetical protein [Candidatus Poribacteria bacterium]